MGFRGVPANPSSDNKQLLWRWEPLPTNLPPPPRSGPPQGPPEQMTDLPNEEIPQVGKFTVSGILN